MPDKTLPLLLGVLGALTVLLGLLLRSDVHRAAQRGPAWRRRLLSAGLILLAGLGIGPATAQAGPAIIAAGAKSGVELAASPAWQAIAKTWREAAAVASGQRGSHPFDRAGKEALLADLKRARDQVGALVKGGLLTENEGLLLISDLDRLTTGVSGYRPTELKMATCYKPVAYHGGRDTLTWFEGRLPLLQKMAVSNKLKPAVVERVLARFEQDLAILADPQASRDLTPPQRKQAAQLSRAARKTMAKIRRALPTGAAADAPKPD